MIIKHLKAEQINGSLVTIDGVKEASFEELATLLPVVVVFMLLCGFDTLTGLGVCLLATCFGFSSAITNPFSVGLAAERANIAVFDGVWLRGVFFICIYFIKYFFFI